MLFWFVWEHHWQDISSDIVYMDIGKNCKRIQRQSRNATHLIAIHHLKIICVILQHVPRKKLTNNYDIRNNSSFLKEIYFRWQSNYKYFFCRTDVLNILLLFILIFTWQNKCIYMYIYLYFYHCRTISPRIQEIQFII